MFFVFSFAPSVVRSRCFVFIHYLYMFVRTPRRWSERFCHQLNTDWRKEHWLSQFVMKAQVLFPNSQSLFINSEGWLNTKWWKASWKTMLKSLWMDIGWVSPLILPSLNWWRVILQFSESNLLIGATTIQKQSEEENFGFSDWPEVCKLDNVWGDGSWKSGLTKSSPYTRRVVSSTGFTPTFPFCEKYALFHLLPDDVLVDNYEKEREFDDKFRDVFLHVKSSFNR